MTSRLVEWHMNSGESGDPDGEATEPTPEDRIRRLIRSGKGNALLAWAMVAVLAGVLGESVVRGDPLWTAFVAATGVIVLVPAVAHRDWRAMPPWELLVLAMFPVLVRGLFGGEIGTFATYVSIAALALVVTVELHSFTALEVTHWFAVAFVVLTTLAIAAVWTILRWNVDGLLGTEFLATNDELMAEWSAVALAGLVAGVLFDAYFKRRGRKVRRLLQRVVRR